MFVKTPYSLYTLDTLRGHDIHKNEVKIQGEYVIARPVRYPSWWNDFKLAWLVFTRRADAFTWPKGQ